MEGILQNSNYYRDMLIQSRNSGQATTVNLESTQTPQDIDRDAKLSISQLGSSALPDQTPILFLPQGNPNISDLGKLLAILQDKVKNALYQSGISRLNADQNVQQAQHNSQLNNLVDLSFTLASLHQVQSITTSANQDLIKGVGAAAEDGLAKATTKLIKLQAEVDLATTDYNNRLNLAQSQEQAAATAVSQNKNALATAKEGLSQAEQRQQQASTALNEAQQNLQQLEAMPQNPEQPDPQLQAAIDDARGAVTAAQSDLATANSQLTAAKELVNTADQNLKQANENLTEAKQNVAQVDRSRLDQLEQAQAALQQQIDSETYAVDVTQVLPKTTELLTTSAAFIDQAAAACPQMSIGKTFFDAMGITPKDGQTASEALTGELSRRLQGTGMSAGEAEALATLVMIGKTDAIATLPKTTLDCIQQFSNDVANASLQANQMLTKEVNRQATELNNLPPADVERVKMLVLTLNSNSITSEEIEGNPVSALLALMGEAVDAIVELAEKQYEERLELEQQLKNHDLV